MRPIVSNNGEGGEVLEEVSMDLTECITQESLRWTSEDTEEFQKSQGHKTDDIIQDHCRTGKLWQGDGFILKESRRNRIRSRVVDLNRMSGAA